MVLLCSLMASPPSTAALLGVVVDRVEIESLGTGGGRQARHP
jgi:hypothetical protein